MRLRRGISAVERIAVRDPILVGELDRSCEAEVEVELIPVKVELIQWRLAGHRRIHGRAVRHELW